MQLNENYPWYLQTSPVFSTLYEKIYNVAKNISPLDSYKVFYPEIMTDASDDLAALSGLRSYASLWQIPAELTSIANALIYDVGTWSTTDRWDGDVTGLTIDWLLRYIKMKTYINQQPFSLNLLHEALDILFGDSQRTITITETQYAITIYIDAEPEAKAVLQGILTVDPTLVGKPMGASITYNLL